MKFHAAIFDMDGVIVDTVPIHFAAWKRMFEAHGHPFTFEEYKQKVDGIPRLDGVRNVLTGLSEAEIQKAATEKQGYFLEAIERMEIPVYDSTIALIHELQKNGVKVAVISASKNAPRMLSRIGLLGRLDATVNGSDVTRGKPDPQVFLIAADRLGAVAGQSVVFEDAVLGVEAARRARMRCVGIDRYGDPDRLKKADIVVSDLSLVSLETIDALFL